MKYDFVKSEHGIGMDTNTRKESITSETELYNMKYAYFQEIILIFIT